MVHLRNDTNFPKSIESITAECKTINQLKHYLLVMYRKIQHSGSSLVPNTCSTQLFASRCICYSNPRLLLYFCRGGSELKVTIIYAFYHFLVRKDLRPLHNDYCVHFIISSRMMTNSAYRYIYINICKPTFKNMNSANKHSTVNIISSYQCNIP